LNQYTSRTVPGIVNDIGTANSNATVTLWRDDGSFVPTYRHKDYYRAEMPINNNTGSVWLTLTNLGVLQNGTNTDIITNFVGNAFLPATPEAFTYDDDGNMTNGGRWKVSWDGENRAISFSCRAGVAGVSNFVSCSYDYMGRRISKSATANGTSTSTKYVYDGWNLVGVLDSGGNLIYSFNWGLDASGSQQGAGGVGGLVSMTVLQGPQAGIYFYSYDGNFNVVALVNATNGAIAAQYEYGPFGELIRATGPLAFANPFLFSTKSFDWETGFYYYGYRFYNPSTGRWLNRDLLGEDGGVNLSCFVKNDPLDQIDPEGLSVLTYSSEAISQRDPWYWSVWLSNDSRKKPSSDSYAEQYVYNFWPTKGGICDTGTAYPPHIGTFAQGSAKNTCSMQVSVNVQCRVTYFVIAAADNPTWITSALAYRPDRTTLLGESLPQHRNTTGGTVHINIISESRTKTLTLSPGQSVELYNVNPSVAGFRGTKGWFIESLHVNCKEL
jgi:RHS repeat-associated protein